ncbi:MAG: acyl carrier protein [Rhodospirillales bacterium]
MSPDDIRAAIFTALADIAPEADPASVRGGEDFRLALDLDSMDFLNLVIALHERLGVDIPEADYPQLATFDGAVAYLGAKVR